jgi:hypothetical protein
VELSRTAHEGTQNLCLFGVAGLVVEMDDVVLDILYECPTGGVNFTPEDQQRGGSITQNGSSTPQYLDNAMFQDLTSFLQQMGRSASTTEENNGFSLLDHKGRPRTIASRWESQSGAVQLWCGERFQVTWSIIQTIARQARLSIGTTDVTRIVTQSNDVVADSDAAMMALTGPVYVTHDSFGQSQEAYGPTIVAVLIHIPRPSVTEGNSFQQSLHHALRRFQAYNVEVPVLSFTDSTTQTIPTWARCLYGLLSTFAYGFRMIIVTMESPDPEASFLEWINILRGYEKVGFEQTRVPILVLQNKTMVHVADFLAKYYNIRAGILVPVENPTAVCRGVVGGMWEQQSGVTTIGCEERIALQTTMLFMHRNIDPSLYTDPNRFDMVWVGSAP